MSEPVELMFFLYRLPMGLCAHLVAAATYAAY
jgi:hypothetical protein